MAARRAQASRHRGWCFTAYPQIEIPKGSGNFIENFDWDGGDAYEAIEDKVKYLVAGKEICPSTKREHHQGYLIWKDAKTMSATAKHLPRGTHVEPQRAEENFDAAKYCFKDDDLVAEFGTRPKPGERNDLKSIKEMVKDGVGMRAITEVYDSFQEIRAGELLMKYMEAKRDWLPEVFWYWGPPGSGKTRLALEKAGENVWISGRNLKWWYDYDGHTDVVIDDFRGDFCTFHELLRILDRYPYALETKGGHRQLLAKRIWITSCYPPEQVYNSREDMGQLLRRISRVMEFKVDPTKISTRMPERWEFIDGKEVLVHDPNPPGLFVEPVDDERKDASQNNTRLERLRTLCGLVLSGVENAQKLSAQTQGSGVILYPDPLPKENTQPQAADYVDDMLASLLDELAG